MLIIRRGFLDPESRKDLIELVRDGSAAHRLARLANALLLLDEGMSCASIARVLFLDDDTIRTWHQVYLDDGIEGLASFNHEGGSCRLAVEQQDKLKAWIAESLPRTTRQVGCWAPKEMPVAVEQSSGRDRLNIHGAIDLETGQTIMNDVLTVDAISTIMLLMAIEAIYPGMRTVHVFLDNARYHQTKLVQAWLTRPEYRIKLHFVPAYCPHLNPIKR